MKMKIPETNYSSADLYYLQQHAENEPVSKAVPVQEAPGQISQDRQQKKSSKVQKSKSKKLAKVKDQPVDSILIMPNNIKEKPAQLSPLELNKDIMSVKPMVPWAQKQSTNVALSSFSSSPRMDDLGSQNLSNSQTSSPKKVHWLERLREIKVARDIRNKEEAERRAGRKFGAGHGQAWDQSALGRAGRARTDRTRASALSGRHPRFRRRASRQARGRLEQGGATLTTGNRLSDERKRTLQEFRATVKKEVAHQMQSYEDKDVPMRQANTA